MTQSKDLGLGWTEHMDPQGRTYYYNANTKESRWDKPQIIVTPAQKALDASPWKEYTDEESDNKYYYNVETQETTWEMPEEYKVLLDRVTTEIKTTLLNNQPQTLAGPTVMEFKTKEDAQDCFYEMMEDFGVDSTWTWENVVRKCHQHRMYRALKSVNERKEVFKKFIDDIKEKEETRKNVAMARDREFFHALYQEHKVNVDTTYDEILPLLQGHADYEDTFPENRKVIFDAYIEKLKNDAKEEARELRKRQLAKFKALLGDLGLSPSVTWREANDIFRERFDQDEELKTMDPMDVLICFEDFIMTMDSQHRQARNSDRKTIFRKERRCREEFYKLLVDLRASGKLHMKSKWKDIYPIIKDDQRYLNMLECLGSSPLDFFRDMIMEMEDDYLPSRRIVMDVTRLIYKAEKEERKYLEKKLRKKIDAFKSFLRHLHPAISVSDKWEDVRQRAQGPEFDALDENHRVEAFERVIQRLAEKTDETSKKRPRSASRGSTIEDTVENNEADTKKSKVAQLSEEEEGELVE